MSYLRGSNNYVWSTTSVLGKGATGAVFQGVNKNNGEPVAVKTFNQLSHMRPPDVQMREFEVIKKVKHENIVKLLAIEEEQEGRGKVIVMELCTGGSLFNILDDPENTYGLHETEFLLVLEHLSAGMKHLRDNNLVHRDLKPGNIMKFVSEDGSNIYKLTDFGAARELHEDQQFMSLYGTEEYLHPDMYERAVLRKPVGKTFGATVDLWSIGVTLYHVATGNLPFRPFGGRKNKETMFRITTQKASGVISGIQTSDNGPIEWGRDLPSNCQLSAGLKKIITPLLAGLLEVDPNRIWGFERFFNEVTIALARKPVHVFFVNKATSIKVFLHAEDTLSDLQQHLLEQTHMIPPSQLLLLGNKLLTSIVDENTPGRGYPETTELEPVLLFSRDNNNVALTPLSDLPKFPNFPNLVSVENDASLAKMICSIGYVCKRRIESLSVSSRLMEHCVSSFTSLISEQLTNLNNRCEHLQDLVQCTQEHTDTIQLSIKCASEVLKAMNKVLSHSGDNLSLPIKDLQATSIPAVHQLHNRYVTESTLSREWKAATRSISCPLKSRADHKARHMVERLRDSWQHLLRDRASRTLTYNDEQFHVLERIKVSETGRRVKALLENEVLPAVNQTTECLADWYKMAHTVFLQSRILEKDVAAFDELFSQYSQKMGNERMNLEPIFGQVTSQVGELASKTSAASPNIKKSNRCAKQIKSNLHALMLAQNEMKIVLKDNTDLIGELEAMTIASCAPSVDDLRL